MLPRIAVAAIDDSTFGYGEIFHKEPGKKGKKIYIYRNRFINKFGAESWDAFFQSTIRVCGTSLLLQIGSLPLIQRDGTLAKNRPIWNSSTSGPQYIARIKKRTISGHSTRLYTIDLQAMFKCLRQ